LLEDTELGRVEGVEDGLELGAFEKLGEAEGDLEGLGSFRG
jgi:hypothetical protein